MRRTLTLCLFLSLGISTSRSFSAADPVQDSTAGEAKAGEAPSGDTKEEPEGDAETKDAKATEEAGPKIATIPVFEPIGAFADGPVEPGFSAILGMSAEPPNLFDLHQALWTAIDDPDVPVVIFDIDNAGLGISQIQSLRREWTALKDAGKEVWMYTKYLSLGTLLLGSEATELVLMPEGDVSLQGMYSEQMYFKNLLDKVGVHADLLHIGDFKSAGEPFTRTEPSEESKRQTNQLIDSIYSQLLDQICTSRGVKKEAFQALIDRGDLTPDDVLDAGLVDSLEYRTEFAKRVRRTFGRKSDFDFNYGMDDVEMPQIGNLMDIFSSFKSMGAKAHTSSKTPAVAVVVFEGEVTAESVAPVRKAIVKATRDRNVRALVLRINSPGGSALESEVLWEATASFRDTGRPFVVSMGDVAASGGYYAACLGNPIYAETGTITGSIGVVGGKFVIKGLLDWAGINTFSFQRGAHADLFSSTDVWDEKERVLIQSSMERVYDVFKSRVMEGRGVKLTQDLDKLAGGRVYTGQQALEIGLVDEIGGLPEAILAAADAAKLGDDYEIRLMPEPKDIFTLIAEGFGQAEDDDEFIRLAAGTAPPSSSFLLHPAIQQSLLTLKGVDPVKARYAEQALRMMHVLSSESMLMASPVPAIRLGK